MRRDMAIAGLRAADIARAAGISPAKVSSFLTGKTRSLKTAHAIAAILGPGLDRYLIDPAA